MALLITKRFSGVARWIYCGDRITEISAVLVGYSPRHKASCHRGAVHSSGLRPLLHLQQPCFENGVRAKQEAYTESRDLTGSQPRI